MKRRGTGKPAPLVLPEPGRRASARRAAARTIGTRLRILVGTVCVLTGLTGLAAPMFNGPVHAEDAGSAVVVHGTGDFAGMTVTIDQTKDLVDQRVHLSWTGAPPTRFKNSAEFAANFLQIMQCWGDPATGPDRTQCQFGVANDGRNAAFGPDTRRLDTQYKPTPPDPITAANVPFRGSDGTLATVYNVLETDPKDTTSFTQLFDRQTTNEVAYAQSASDGTGQADFETETVQEAPHLGCGKTVMTDDKGHPYQCYLVIVPRGETEVDGHMYNDPTRPEKELVSSPLAAANWANHISVPISFMPQNDACPTGQKTYPIAGSEQMAEAMRLWAPEVCHLTSAQYNLIRLSDDQSRALLANDDPGLSFVGRALNTDDTAPSGPVVYAPVALSGLTITYEIDQISAYSAKPDVKVHDGTPLTGMRLTPKLVAKLLTQSYRNAVHVYAPEMTTGGALADNPTDISEDPEFQALNPQFNGLLYQLWISNSVLTPASGADAISQLWAWINGDADARAFLDGVPDKTADGKPGMVVNPAYKNLTLPLSIFPKQDPFCYVSAPLATPPSPPLCAADLHPWAASMLIAGRSIARGNGLAKTVWNTANTPPSFDGATQDTGKHALMGVIDTATAQRFGLQTAYLENASGGFAGPDEDGLTAAATSMPVVDSIPVPDPRTKTPGAYPLAQVTYAATVPGKLTKDEGNAYADFLSFAVSGGQTPGSSIGKLAPGYVPLPLNLKFNAENAITAIRALAGTARTAGGPSGSGPSGSPGPGQVINVVVPPLTTSSAAGGAATGNPGQQNSPPAGSTGTVPPTSAAKPTGGGVITPTPQTSVTPLPPSLTPASRFGAIRMVLLVLLVAGGGLLLAGPALRTWAAKIPRRAIPSGVHLE
ncbi:hypothetical protein GCM10009839_45730 [Catenulispora yoronensis]|uniref:PBP domain-containing protein n=1 Tax=Catenulispora yoronensis TaxID=450799 RepID=A0ABN2UKI5_9ACTN